jgi:hypothetical protein
LALNIKELVFAATGYALINVNRIKGGIAVVLIWIAVKLIHGTSVLVFEPISIFTIGIFGGELLMSGVLFYFVLQEINAMRVTRNKK